VNGKKNSKALFKVGDWVAFQLPFGEAIAQVVEDRGPIGYRGRRLYGLRRPPENGEADYFELPEIALRTALCPNGKES